MLFGDDADDMLGDEDWVPPGANYLAQFRKPMSEEEFEEVAADFVRATITWLNETEE